MNYVQIAIDGPAGAGKSTIAKLIAKHYKYTYVDTGAMYRAITLQAMRLQIDLSNPQAFDFIDSLHFEFKEDELWMNNEDVSHEIRTQDVSNNVSLVSSHLHVREQLVQMQQQMSNRTNVVMDGRDIGYKVLPHANYKFFLTASTETRALRRHKENISKGITSDLATIEEEIKRRDYLDTTRKHSPLRPAEDAVIIDTSDMTIEQVVTYIIQAIREVD